MGVLNPIVRGKAAAILKDVSINMVPQLIENVLVNEFQVPFVGMFHTEFLKAPQISPNGMVAEMNIQQGKRPLF